MCTFCEVRHKVREKHGRNEKSRDPKKDVLICPFAAQMGTNKDIKNT
jgi:hypothetical protein